MDPNQPTGQPPQQPQPVQQQQYYPQPSAPIKAGQSSIPFGLIGLIVSVVGLIILPILLANMGSSYMLLIIALLIGLAGAGLSVYALKQSGVLNVIALSGFIIGVVVTSISLTDLVQYAIVYNKTSSYQSPS